MEILSASITRTSLFVLGIIGLITSSMISGCVPSPSSNDDAFPEFSLLSTFYTPRDSGRIYLWQDSSAGDANARIVSREFVGSRSCPLNIGYANASNFQITDVLTSAATELPVVITDSVVIEFASIGNSINPVSRLSGLLSVGRRWSACDAFVTSNGSIVVDSARVDGYFASTSVQGVQYENVYHVTYWIADVISGPGPVEPEFQKGATLGVYYAKLIGPTYVIAKDPSGKTIRVSQLIETRTR